MFETLHTSVEDSRPVTLYKITHGSKISRYTSAETDIVVNSDVYAATLGIKHTKISNSGEANKNKVTVEVTRDFEMASWLMAYVPTTEILLSIYSFERDDISGGLIHEFTGVYLMYTSKYPAFKMEFAPLDYDSNKQVMRYSFSPICQHTQYDDYCSLDQNAFLKLGTVTDVTGDVITTDQTLTAISADHYVGGYVELSGVYGLERAWIVSQSGSAAVNVDRVLPAAVVGATIKLYPSCRGEFDRCKNPSLFNNKSRFFGGVNANKINPFSPSGVKSSV